MFVNKMKKFFMSQYKRLKHWLFKQKKSKNSFTIPEPKVEHIPIYPEYIEKSLREAREWLFDEVSRWSEKNKKILEDKLKTDPKTTHYNEKQLEFEIHRIGVQHFLDDPNSHYNAMVKITRKQIENLTPRIFIKNQEGKTIIIHDYILGKKKSN